MQRLDFSAMKEKLLLTTALVIALALSPLAAHAQQKTVMGPDKQRLTATQTTKLKDGQLVKVTGTKFDRRVGIYLAFCELPKPGKQPTNCAGGVNAEGDSQSSFWISSNAPAYAGDLVKTFSPRGGFILNIQVSRQIGATDCAVKKCAILTRADHLKPSFRRADVVIPVSFQK